MLMFVLFLLVVLFSKQPCTKTLRELNISNNRFGDNGLYMLKLGLLANRSVVKLSLSCTRITCEGNCLRKGKKAKHNLLGREWVVIAGMILTFRSHCIGGSVGRKSLSHSRGLA